MSTDYDLYCVSCKARVETVASGSIAYGNKLWRDEQKLSQLQTFLFAHVGHHLIFQDCQIIDDLEDAEREGE
ncbi:hypothetical protein [Paraburkholderia sp. 2C]